MHEAQEIQFETEMFATKYKYEVPIKSLFSVKFRQSSCVSFRQFHYQSKELWECPTGSRAHVLRLFWCGWSPLKICLAQDFTTVIPFSKVAVICESVGSISSQKQSNTNAKESAKQALNNTIKRKYSCN